MYKRQVHDTTGNKIERRKSGLWSGIIDSLLTYGRHVWLLNIWKACLVGMNGGYMDSELVCKYIYNIYTSKYIIYILYCTWYIIPGMYIRIS